MRAEARGRQAVGTTGLQVGCTSHTSAFLMVLVCQEGWNLTSQGVGWSVRVRLYTLDGVALCSVNRVCLQLGVMTGNAASLASVVEGIYRFAAAMAST
jgi:hypothetical protein